MSEKLLQRGDRVAGTTRKLDPLEDLKEKYSAQLWLTHLDLTDTSGIRRAVDQAFAHFGQIDVLVNNAAYGLFGASEELTDDPPRNSHWHRPKGKDPSPVSGMGAFAS